MLRMPLGARGWWVTSAHTGSTHKLHLRAAALINPPVFHSRGQRSLPELPAPPKQGDWGTDLLGMLVLAAPVL